MHSELIDQIRYWHRTRCFVMEQRKRADLALGSFLRFEFGWSRNATDDVNSRAKDAAKKIIECGEKVFKGKEHPLIDTEEWTENGATVLASIEARAPFDKIETQATKEMESLAKQLPVWEFLGEHVRGFGARSLAVIVGEAGDLSLYPDHSKLWKRMGLAPFTKDGVTRMGSGWRRAGGLTKDEWMAIGYSPVRRSRMFVIGDSLVKSNGDGKYRQTYLARKAYLRERAEAIGLIVAPAAKIPAKRRDEFVSEGQIHLQAQGYIEKKLLRDLHGAWRRADQGISSNETIDFLPDALIRNAGSEVEMAHA